MRWVVALVVTAACYSPSPHPGAACAAGRTCPDGLVCSSATDTCELADVDARRDVPDDAFVVPDAFVNDAGQVCFGTGLVVECFDSAPSGDRVLAGTLSTDEACDDPNSKRCVIAAATISIPEFLTTTGSRPLVLVATDTISVPANGRLDASSHAGAGAGPAAGTFPCVDMASDALGGGAGGSFTTRGGSGGISLTGGSSGGASADPVPAALRPGCNGRSGDGQGQDAPGGHGGGVVYLIAGQQITVDGAITANGAGGLGGKTNSGGGGGGAGGLVGLDAPVVTVSGIVGAVGGGGGGGAGAIVVFGTLVLGGTIAPPPTH